MSQHRISPDAGWAVHSKLARGPNGRALCRRCGVEVPKGRVTFCSGACVDAWKLKTQPAFARRLVFDRDHGICSKCGRDCEALARRIVAWIGPLRVRAEGPSHNDWTYPEVSVDLVRRSRALKWIRRFSLDLRDPWSRRPTPLARSLWQADHIVPVIEGGGECGLENLRTLCTPCHKGETATLARRRAEARRAKAVA